MDVSVVCLFACLLGHSSCKSSVKHQSCFQRTRILWRKQRSMADKYGLCESSYDCCQNQPGVARSREIALAPEDGDLQTPPRKAEREQRTHGGKLGRAACRERSYCHRAWGTEGNGVSKNKSQPQVKIQGKGIGNGWAPVAKAEKTC